MDLSKNIKNRLFSRYFIRPLAIFCLISPSFYANATASSANPQSEIHELALQGDNSTYDEWAATYDDNVQSWHWTAPKKIATKIIALRDNKQIKLNKNTSILDAGCGTGLVAEQLRTRHIPGKIKGVDLNAEMVRHALEKTHKGMPLYDDLEVADLLDLGSSQNFDLIISSGVFLEGHCGPTHLQALLQEMNPEGVALVTVRKTFYEAEKKEFESVLAHYKAEFESMDDYIDGGQAYLLTIRHV